LAKSSHSLSSLVLKNLDGKQKKKNSVLGPLFSGLILQKGSSSFPKQGYGEREKVMENEDT